MDSVSSIRKCDIKLQSVRSLQPLLLLLGSHLSAHTGIIHSRGLLSQAIYTPMEQLQEKANLKPHPTVKSAAELEKVVPSMNTSGL